MFIPQVKSLLECFNFSYLLVFIDIPSLLDLLCSTTGRPLSVLSIAILQVPEQLPVRGRLSTNTVDGINPGSSPHLFKPHFYLSRGILALTLITRWVI